MDEEELYFKPEPRTKREKYTAPIKSVKEIIKLVDGDEKYSKKRYRSRRKTGREPQNSINDQLYPEAGNTVMIDIVKFPETSEGYEYLLVATDVVSKAFDMEPLKNKDSKTVLDAFLRMTERNFIDMPKYYLVSDQGSEFKSVFNKYMYDHSIFHKSTHRGRHKQLANVDNLIATLGRIFNVYMNSKEVETGHVYKNWTDILQLVRNKLNQHRKVDVEKLKEEYEKNPPLPELTTEVIKKENGKGSKLTKEIVLKKPKYKVGQYVYRLLEIPKNALGKDQYGKFREGDFRIDTVQRRISEIVTMNGKGPTFRYVLEGIPYVSYDEGDLRLKL